MTHSYNVQQVALLIIQSIRSRMVADMNTRRICKLIARMFQFRENRGAEKGMMEQREKTKHS